jgi:hypothetical protein
MTSQVQLMMVHPYWNVALCMHTHTNVCVRDCCMWLKYRCNCENIYNMMHITFNLSWILIYCKGKVKFTLEQATQAQSSTLYPRERPGTHCIGGWVGPRASLDRWGKSRPYPPPGFDLWTIQPVASHYTSYPGPLWYIICYWNVFGSVPSS